MAVDIQESGWALRQLRDERQGCVRAIRKSRKGWLAALAGFVPVFGMVWAISCEQGYTVTDASKDRWIGRKLAELVEKYPQIRPLFHEQEWWERHVIPPTD